MREGTVIIHSADAWSSDVVAGADSQGGSQFSFSQHLHLQTILGYWGSVLPRRTLGSRQRVARLPVLAPMGGRWRVLWLGDSWHGSPNLCGSADDGAAGG